MSATETISVIIPTLNEADSLPGTLESAADPRAELVVVDGGSSDATLQIAHNYQARVLESPGGRAVQMNTGASHGHGQVLLFLHADTILPSGYCSAVFELLSLNGVAAGAFRLRIDGQSPSLRLIERVANLRSLLFQFPYGDQALFLTATTFREIGGFRELPIMEDFDMVRRLRRVGKVALATQSVKTSARRWETVGPWKTTVINQLMVMGHFAGWSPKRLADFYRSRNGQ